MKILWVMTPWLDADMPTDTTPRLMHEAQLKGYQNYWCSFREIYLKGGQVYARAYQVIEIKPDIKGRLQSESFILKPCPALKISSLDYVFYRTDPPVDLGYLQPLQHLQLAKKDSKNLKILNPIESLMLFNEKTWGASFGKLYPKTFVASQFEPLMSYGQTQKKVVLKPLHLCQSIGIELLDFTTQKGQKNAYNLLKKLTQNWVQPVLLQEYLPEIDQGETRLWFAGDDLLCSAKKYPKKGEFKIDLDRGGTVGPWALTKAQKKIADKIADRLRQNNIKLAAVDLIGQYITDFNITSPGALTLMEKVYQKNFAKQVIERVIK